jgi:predicted aspartyl protease
VPIESARSSHVLVRPTIDGLDVGPFILDTGASGLVISSRRVLYTGPHTTAFAR